MATSRELLERRWKLLMVDLERFANEAEPSTVNNKRQRRVTDVLEEIGALAVGEATGSEYDALSGW